MKVARKSVKHAQTSGSKTRGKVSVQAKKATGAVGRLRTQHQAGSVVPHSQLLKRSAENKSSELIINSVKQGLREVALIEKGEVKPRSIDQLLDEL